MLSLKTVLAVIALASQVQAKYYTVQGYTSNGHDMTKIGELDLDDRIQWCDQRPRCVAFDSNGNTRKALQPRSMWERVVVGKNERPYTLYIKTSAAIPPDSYERGFEHYKGYLILTNSITRVVNDLDDQKQWCHRRKKCIGFNSNGWMKSGSTKQKDWAWLGVGKSTLYIKGRYASRK
jgi:hypothetical protein